jgi:hypothetical protein
VDSNLLPIEELLCGWLTTALVGASSNNQPQIAFASAKAGKMEQKCG